MNCFNHPALAATATCQNCGRGLCTPCSSRFTLLRCQPCILQNNAAVARKTYASLAATALIFIVTFVFVGNIGSMGMPPPSSHALRHMHNVQTANPGIAAQIMVGLLMAFTYWGYKFLSARMPRVVIGTPFVWFFYFMLKFVLAYFIGVFVGPYQIYKSIRELRIVQRTKGQIARGEI